jgi:HEAT repeat protein
MQGGGPTDPWVAAMISPEISKAEETVTCHIGGKGMKRSCIAWAVLAVAAAAAGGCADHAVVRRGSPEAAAEVQRFMAMLKSSDGAERAWAAWQLGELGSAAAPAVPALLAMHDQLGVPYGKSPGPGDANVGDCLPGWSFFPWHITAGFDYDEFEMHWPEAEISFDRPWEPKGPRDAAILALRHIGPAAEHDLVAALADKAETKRILAAAALNPRTMPGATAALVRALSDESFEVQSAAERSLLDTPDPRAALSYLLGAPSREHSSLASPEVVDALAALLNKEEEGTVEAAAHALREIGTDRARDALLRALERMNAAPMGPDGRPLPDDKFHRRPVIEALGAFPTPEVTRALISYLDHTDHCWSLIYALAEMGPLAVEPLREALKQPKTRSQAADVLGVLDKAGTAVLIEAAQSEDREVRFESLLALYCNPDSVPVVVRLLDDPDPEIREIAGKWLAALHAPEAVEPLVKTLLSPLPERRREAAKMLCNLEVPRTVDTLIAFLKDSDGEVAVAAGYALVTIGDTRATEPLVGYFERVVAELDAVNGQPPDTAFRDRTDIFWPSYEKLFVGPDAKRVAPRLAQLLADQYTPHRPELAWMLGRIGDPRPAPVLLKIMQDAAEPDDVRVSAASSLARLDSVGAIKPIASFLRQRMGEIDWDHPARYPWGFRPEDPTWKAIDDAYKADNGRRSLCFKLAAVLAETHLEAAAQVLESLLDNENATVRYIGALNLAERKNPRGRGILLRCVRGEENPPLPIIWSLREDEVRALASYGDDESIHALLDMLDDQGKESGAENVLKQMGYRAIPWLLEAQQHPNSEIRCKTAEILGLLQDEITPENEQWAFMPPSFFSTETGHPLMKDPRAAEALRRCLENPDSYVRANAAVNLGDRRDRLAVDQLIAALDDAHWPVRWKAAEALGKIGDKRAVMPLCRALTDEADLVRLAAAEALGPFHDRRATAALTAALADSREEVRLVAAWALVAIGDGSAAPAVDLAAAKETRLDQRRLMQAAADILHQGDTFKALIAALDNTLFEVYEHAAVALGMRGDKRAVGPLVRALGLRYRTVVDGGYYPTPTSEALQRLTGANLTPGPEFWYRWWAENQSRYPSPAGI